MAEEMKATVFGSLAAKNIQKALKRIFFKVRKQDFNCLEVRKMVEHCLIGGIMVTRTAPLHSLVSDATSISRRRTPSRVG